VARWTTTRLVFTAFTALGVLIGAALVFQWWTLAPVTAPAPLVDGTGGSYAALTPAQRALVDDATVRFGQATAKQVEPGRLFDSLPLSTKTTFDAVTHALSQTRLTGADGASLNLTALDLVARVDAVAGSVPDAGGDKQFRMYVQLRPDTRKILESSREFSRQVDNTVYHKGYPICFRGTGNTPNIQFSLSPDGTRADIDVDYRASEFPIMLLNGHLTASNSDVRAGNNDERHNGHWQGLDNWWRSFMGVVTGEVSSADASESKKVAAEPRLGKGTRPEEAIADFLKAWLVEQNPGIAAGYIAPRAYACLETKGSESVDRGVARFQIVAAMHAVNNKTGNVDSLSRVLEGVPLTGTRAREVPQPNRDAFVMYDLRDDLAASLDCENRLHPELADADQARSTSFGHYVGAVFRLKAGGVAGDSVATLWSEERGVWKLVAFAVEPEFTPSALPHTPPTAETPAAPLPVIDGDREMLRAADVFFNTWVIKKDPAAAFRQFSEQSYTCYNAFHAEGAPAAATRAEAGKLLLAGMTRASEWVGTATRLEDLVTAIEPHHPDLKLVKHAASDAFTVVAIPDSMGAAAECDRLKPGVVPRVDRDGPETYGRFYAASVRFKRAGADGAVLWTVWAREDDAWRIVSYLVIVP
jgi:hypothetical protein